MLRRVLSRARSLVSGSSHRWLGGPIAGLAEPFTVVAWIRKVGTPPTGYAVFSADTIGGTSRWQISVNATNVLTALAVNTAGTAGTANGPGTVTDSTWVHAAAVFAASNSRTAYVNGVAGSPNVTAITVSGVDSYRIGARVTSGVEALYFNGDLGPQAIYRGALTAHEIGLLSRGRSPLTVRPQALLALVGMDQPTNDLYDLIRRERLAANGRPSIILFPKQLLHPPLDPTFAIGAFAGAPTSHEAAVALSAATAAVASVNGEHGVAVPLTQAVSLASAAVCSTLAALSLSSAAQIQATTGSLVQAVASLSMTGALTSTRAVTISSSLGLSANAAVATSVLAAMAGVSSLQSVAQLIDQVVAITGSNMGLVAGSSLSTIPGTLASGSFSLSVGATLTTGGSLGVVIEGSRFVRITATDGGITVTAGENRITVH